MSATDDDDWKLSQKGKKEEWVLRRAKTEQRKCSSEHRRRWQEESRCRRCVTSIRWCWWLIRLSVVLVCIFAYLHCRAKRRWAHKDEHEQHCGQHIPQSAAAVKLLNWHCATQLSYIIAHHKEDGRLNKTKVLLPTRAQAPDLVFLFFLFKIDRCIRSCCSCRSCVTRADDSGCSWSKTLIKHSYIENILLNKNYFFSMS